MYKEYIQTNTSSHDKWAFEILTGFIVADKFRGAALHALDNYCTKEDAGDAIRAAFEWAHFERGYFNNGAMEYYLQITLDMFNLFEPCGICKKSFTVETLHFHVKSHLVNVHG